MLILVMQGLHFHPSKWVYNIGVVPIRPNYDEDTDRVSVLARMPALEAMHCHLIHLPVNLPACHTKIEKH